MNNRVSKRVLLARRRVRARHRRALMRGRRMAERLGYKHLPPCDLLLWPAVLSTGGYHGLMVVVAGAGPVWTNTPEAFEDLIT